MLFLRTLGKRSLMGAVFAALWVFSFVSRKKRIETPKTIGILFLNQGLGDLVMLSPVIQAIVDGYPESEVTLITNLPTFIGFKHLSYTKPEEVKKEKRVFDLLLSPTLSLHHIPFVFHTQTWFGYFARPRSQSNVGLSKAKYDLASGHYLERGMALLDVLLPESGEKVREGFVANTLEYPPIITDETFQPPPFLKGGDYIVLAPISKHRDREWPYERWAEVFATIQKERVLPPIVLIGDASAYDKERGEMAMQTFQEKGVALHNCIGTYKLNETASLIARSSAFFGLDSGPAHIAYQIASYSFVLFVTVRPEDRTPHGINQGNIDTFAPSPQYGKALYNGLGNTSPKQARARAASISPEDVAQTYLTYLS